MCRGRNFVPWKQWKNQEEAADIIRKFPLNWAIQPWIDHMATVRNFQLNWAIQPWIGHMALVHNFPLNWPIQGWIDHMVLVRNFPLNWPIQGWIGHMVVPQFFIHFTNPPPIVQHSAHHFCYDLCKHGISSGMAGPLREQLGQTAHMCAWVEQREQAQWLHWLTSFQLLHQVRAKLLSNL